MLSTKTKYIQICPFIGIAVLFLMLCTSCGTKKYLNDGEAFVKKNIIDFKSKENLKNKSTLKYDLSTVIKQKRNRQFLFVPRRYFWYKTEQQDTLKFFGRYARRVIAEPPSIYRKDLADETASSMQYYLINRGFFEAEVYYKTEIKRKKSYTTYTVYPGKLYHLEDIEFESKDTLINEILQDMRKESLLKDGSPADGKLYDLEINRIVKGLRNKGYAQFYSNYMDQPTGDSTDYKIKMNIEALRIADSIAHKTFRIGKIQVYPQFIPQHRLQEIPDTTINNIEFFLGGQEMKIKPKNILRAIKFKTGDLYKQDDIEESINQLSNIGVFRYISPKSSIDTERDTIMNFKIFMSMNKRQEVGYDVEFNNSRYSSVDETGLPLSLLGVGLNLNYKNRNAFGNAEQFTFDVNTGADLDFNRDTRLFYSIDLNLTSKLDLPRFIDLTGIYKVMNGVHRLTNKIRKKSKPWTFYNALKGKATSRVTLGYTFHDQIDFSKYNSFEASFGYNLKRNETDEYSINQIGINYFIPDKSRPRFKEILDANPFLDKSLDKQLFTGFLFRNLHYTHAGLPNTNGASFQYLGDIEISGLEVWAANAFENWLTNTNEVWMLDSIAFSQYIVLNAEVRHNRQISPTQSLAFRIGAGFATPFGTSKEVPYVKQLFAGGPSSIRGWRIRELGPGAFEDDTLPLNNSFYQTGEFKLEMNAEYRFDMFWLFDGAIFMDVGNVWAVKEDKTRPGSELLLKPKFNEDLNEYVGDNFLKQLAMSPGIGLRLDTYFFIRFDIGLKMRSPYKIDGSNWLFKQYSSGTRDWLNYNLAIGYPF